jgi:hypothetical protein
LKHLAATLEGRHRQIFVAKQVDVSNSTYFSR